MKQQTISKVLEIINQQISCEEIQKLLNELQNEVDEHESSFVFKCKHALSPSILPVECVDCIKEYVLDSISSDEYNALEIIATQTTNTYFRAVCGELIWQKTHCWSVGELEALYFIAVSL